MKKLIDKIGLETFWGGIFAVITAAAIITEVAMANFEPAAIAGGVKDLFGTLITIVMLIVAVRALTREKPETLSFEDRMTDEVWYIIRNTRGCTGFVGPEGVPVPLTESEIEKFGVEKHTVELNFAEGDLVTIIDGPFAGYSGVVSRIDIEDDVVCVILPIMGRDTPIDLSLDQVESAVD